MPAYQVPSRRALQQALDRLLTDPRVVDLCPVGAHAERLQDDTDGETDAAHRLRVSRPTAHTFELAVGEQAFAATTETTPRAVLNAVAVLGVALHRDNAARPSPVTSTALSTWPNPAPDLAKALAVVLETPHFIPTLTGATAYRAPSHALPAVEGAAADDSSNQPVTVFLASDNDAHVWTDRHALRFREDFGGGLSLRTREALLLLAEAFRRCAD